MKQFQVRPPPPLCCDTERHLYGFVGGIGVEDEEDLPGVGGSEERSEKANEDIGVEAA